MMTLYTTWIISSHTWAINTSQYKSIFLFYLLFVALSRFVPQSTLNYKLLFSIFFFFWNSILFMYFASVYWTILFLSRFIYYFFLFLLFFFLFCSQYWIKTLCFESKMYEALFYLFLFVFITQMIFLLLLCVNVIRDP